MSDNHLPELDADLQALLRAGRPGVEVSKDDQESLAASMSSWFTPSAPDTPPTGEHGPAGSGGAARRAIARAIQSKAAAGIVGVALGVILGAAGHAWLASPPVAESRPVPNNPIAAPPPPTTSAVAPPSAVPQASAESAKSAMVAASSADRGTVDVDLNAERALIDVARAAIARGQPKAAIETLSRHARSFPKGRLAEEREALMVRALAMSGDTEKAKERDEQFRKRYPGSLLLPPIASSVP